MSKVYTTHTEVLQKIRYKLTQLSSELAFDSNKISEKDQNDVLAIIRLLQLIIDSDQAIAQTGLTNENIRPANSTSYPTQTAKTITINLINRSPILENTAKQVLELVEKAERYDILYKMKPYELKDLEAKAYNEKKLRENS